MGTLQFGPDVFFFIIKQSRANGDQEQNVVA